MADPATIERRATENEVALSNGVGRPTGTDGLLDLTLGLATRGSPPSRPRTVLRHVRHRFPLQLGRLLYPDPQCPDLAFVYVAMLSGGFVQGDRTTQRIVVQPGARAHVTTLSATKIYGMPRHGATQRIDLTAAAGALLEWWPDPIIPFKGARFQQEVTLTVDPQAILLYGDLLLPGRMARQERHDYATYSTRVTARRPDGTLLFADTQALAPSPPGAPPFVTTLPTRQDTIGTAYVLAPRDDLDPLLAHLRAALADLSPPCKDPSPGILAGSSLLPSDCGAVVRLLAPDGLTARRAMHAVWQCTRRALLGVLAPDVRKP